MQNQIRTFPTAHERPRKVYVAAMLAIGGMIVAHAGLPAPATAGDTWTAKNVYDPFTSRSHCVAESVHQRMHDGYQDTVIYLQVDAKHLTIVTESNIDPESPHNAIRVDENDAMKPDKIQREQTALFERDADHIVDQFRRGLKVVVTLQFWPTWPDKGAKQAEFSLIGFTQAFAKLPNC